MDIEQKIVDVYLLTSHEWGVWPFEGNSGVSVEKRKPPGNNKEITVGHWSIIQLTSFLR